MPRKQDFSNSVIYHIRNKETKHVIYVGSTTNFQQRKITHKFCYNNEKHKEYNKSCYVFIRENEGWDFYEVIPIEFLKLENKTQLAIAEQVEIDKQYNLKNNRKSHRTEENKKEYMKEYLKEYMKENKEKIAEKHKEYYEENKEEINKKSRQYHKENKETITEKHKEYSKEKVECPNCKYKCNRSSLKRHQGRNICKSFIHRPCL